VDWLTQTRVHQSGLQVTVLVDADGLMACAASWRLEPVPHENRTINTFDCLQRSHLQPVCEGLDLAGSSRLMFRPLYVHSALIRERCNVVSPQEGVGSAREIWGVVAREGEHLAVTCRFLGDVEVDGSAGCLTVRCVRQRTPFCARHFTISPGLCHWEGSQGYGTCAHGRHSRSANDSAHSAALCGASLWPLEVTPTWHGTPVHRTRAP